MPPVLIKVRFWIPLLGLTLGTVLATPAQDARFYRVAGPVPTQITELRSDGWITWMNSPTNAVFRIESRTSLESQSEWKDYLQVPGTGSSTTWRILDFHPPSGMVFVPAGVFQMGDSMAELDFNSPRPVHEVFVSACYMDRFEVTGALWDEVATWATNHGYKFTFPGTGKAPAHPVS